MNLGSKSRCVASLYLLIAALCIGFAGAALAERYRDPAVVLQALIAQLDDHAGQLQALLQERQRLDQWRRRLDARQAQLTQAAGAAGPGPQQKADFAAEVARYNDQLVGMRARVRRAARWLKGRSPAQVADLIAEMQQLKGVLQDAMARGDPVAAQRAADRSPLARKLGYQ